MNVYIFLFFCKQIFLPKEVEEELWHWYDFDRKSALDGTLYMAVVFFREEENK